MRDELFSAASDDPSGATSHGAGLWTRRVFVTLFTLLAAIAVVGVFGQRPAESVVRRPQATLRLSAPKHVRGGLLFQARVTITATSRIQYPRVVLDQGWLQGMQVNSIEPAAMSESSRNGRLVLSYDALEPGDVMRVWLQFQVDPTYPGKRRYGVEIDDQATPLARVERRLRVWP